jgi:O-antigen ligase
MSTATLQSRRTVATAILIVAAFAVSLLFKGTGVNLLYLGIAGAALLGAIGCAGTAGVAPLWAANRFAMLLALSMLGYLLVAFRLSISPDSSFAPSWVLAAGPLTFIAAAAVVRDRGATRILLAAVVAIAVGLASVSSFRFAMFGERAHLPLTDPNNYATLMYLVWIPLVHRYLADGWSGRSTTIPRHAFALAASFVLLLALIATRSRTALLVVAAAAGVWLVLGLSMRRMPWRRFGGQLAVAGVALALAGVLAAQHAAAGKGLAFGDGLSVRLALDRAALAMFAQHPFGIGVFCFSLLYPGFRSLAEQDTAGLFVHNDYLQFLVEGGLPLCLLLVAFAAAVWLGLLRGVRARNHLGELGFVIALAAGCAHAFVNFVFYSLPVTILMGLLAARAFVARPGGVEAVARPMPRGIFGTAIAAGWIVWSYLALDIVTVGVFQGQPSLPLVAGIRRDPDHMLEYARIAQRLNGNRGIPALGEAMLLYRQARAEPESRYLREQAYRQFHRALQVDPWNTLTYLRLAQFVDEFPSVADAERGETVEQLLLSAVSLDPMYVPAIDALLQYYAATSQGGKAYALLRNVVYPWMRRLHRNDASASERYFDLLEGVASDSGDSKFLAELKAQRAALTATT